MREYLFAIGLGSLAVAALLMWGLLFYLMSPLLVAAWATGGEWRVGVIVLGLVFVGGLALVFTGPPGPRLKTPQSSRPWFSR